MSGYCPDCGNTRCICNEVECPVQDRSELLACPFCGGNMAARLMIHYPDYQVACNDCGARGPRRGPYGDTQTMIRLWNTRAKRSKGIVGQED